MNYSKNELLKLSSHSSLIRLLRKRKPKFDEVLQEAKYWDELRALQIELIKLQNWILEKNERLLIIFEGGELSGKGLTIRAVLEHLNPRSARSIALPKPTQREAGQWYFQRYINRLPDPGDIVLFDRSWYNRAIVEPVHGFCTKKQYKRFMGEVGDFEKMLYHDGLLLLKFYFNISKKEQARRITSVKNDPLKRWQLSKVDLRAQELWDKFKEYEKAMMKTTDTKNIPWTIIDGTDQNQAQLDTIRHILNRVPYNKGNR